LSTLAEDAQQHIERMMQELSGDEDFLPFMTIKDREDRVVLAGLVMPQDPDEKDQIANMMTALCMVHRGVEVIFASSSWMVYRGSGDPDPYQTGQPLSKHPDRIEMAFVVVVNIDGQCAMHSAPLIRENNMVGVGMWSSTEPSAAKVAGRFAEAIHVGMELGQQLPPEVCEYIDSEARKEGRLESLVQSTVQMIREARTGASRN
jgi:hypothetical protein